MRKGRKGEAEKKEDYNRGQWEEEEKKKLRRNRGERKNSRE